MTIGIDGAGPDAAAFDGPQPDSAVAAAIARMSKPSGQEVLRVVSSRFAGAAGSRRLPKDRNVGDERLEDESRTGGTSAALPRTISFCIETNVFKIPSAFLRLTKWSGINTIGLRGRAEGAPCALYVCL